MGCTCSSSCMCVFVNVSRNASLLQCSSENWNKKKEWYQFKTRGNKFFTIGLSLFTLILAPFTPCLAPLTLILAPFTPNLAPSHLKVLFIPTLAHFMPILALQFTPNLAPFTPIQVWSSTFHTSTLKCVSQYHQQPCIYWHDSQLHPCGWLNRTIQHTCIFIIVQDSKDNFFFLLLRVSRQGRSSGKQRTGLAVKLEAKNKNSVLWILWKALQSGLSTISLGGLLLCVFIIVHLCKATMTTDAKPITFWEQIPNRLL